MVHIFELQSLEQRLLLFYLQRVQSNIGCDLCFIHQVVTHDVEIYDQLEGCLSLLSNKMNTCKFHICLSMLNAHLYLFMKHLRAPDWQG